MSESNAPENTETPASDAQTDDLGRSAQAEIDLDAVSGGSGGQIWEKIWKH